MKNHSHQRNTSFPDIFLLLKKENTGLLPSTIRFIENFLKVSQFKKRKYLQDASRQIIKSFTYPRGYYVLKDFFFKNKVSLFLKRELNISDNKAYGIAILIILLMLDMSRMPEQQVSAKVLLFSIAQYRKFVSPNLKGIVRCKFEPTCSQYGYKSIEQHGAFWGSLKTLNRLCRCSPFSKTSGYDPP